MINRDKSWQFKLFRATKEQTAKEYLKRILLCFNVKCLPVSRALGEHLFLQNCNNQNYSCFIFILVLGEAPSIASLRGRTTRVSNSKTQ